MIDQTARAAAAAIFGALAAAVSLTLAYAKDPTLRLEMDRDLPRRIAAGLYPAERAGDQTFAWTAKRADLKLPGLSRDVPWACTVRYRGGRGEPLPQPLVEIAIDGLTLARRTATNEFEEVEVTAPARPARPGLVLTIASSATVVPGPSDPRELGVQLDRLVCRPAGEGVPFPPRHAVIATLAAGAIFGGALVLAGVPLVGAAAAVALTTVFQAFALSSGPAPYGTFSDTLVRLAIWIALLMLMAVKVLEAATRKRLEETARFVIVFSACALYIKLLGLLHPSKLVIDALFHAHRFQAVLGGNYYFTQVMPGGVGFPYAIGLYLFAAPWSAFTRDHITLLRIVVSASEIIAGALLYLVIVRTWGDRRVAALAVVLFNTVPLPYGLVGNANLTNAFGQSVALVTIAAAAVWSLRPRDFRQLITVFLLAGLALLSHISTAAILFVTLVALAFFYRWRGGPSLHRTAWSVLAVTMAAVLFSIATYYGHFVDVYRTLARVRASPAAVASGEAGETRAPPVETSKPRVATPLLNRIAHALGLTITAIGWPIVLLAVAGLWRVWASGAGDRLTLVLGAWGVAYCVFLGIGIFPRVDASFERYAAEFVGRVVFATYPAVVILAARGALWGVRAGPAPRLASAVLLVASFLIGVQHWARWMA